MKVITFHQNDESVSINIDHIVAIIEDDHNLNNATLITSSGFDYETQISYTELLKKIRNADEL